MRTLDVVIAALVGSVVLFAGRRAPRGKDRSRTDAVIAPPLTMCTP